MKIADAVFIDAACRMLADSLTRNQFPHEFIPAAVQGHIRASRISLKCIEIDEYNTTTKLIRTICALLTSAAEVIFIRLGELD
jgi:hypothetical protein